MHLSLQSVSKKSALYRFFQMKFYKIISKKNLVEQKSRLPLQPQTKGCLKKQQVLKIKCKPSGLKVQNLIHFR